MVKGYIETIWGKIVSFLFSKKWIKYAAKRRKNIFIFFFQLHEQSMSNCMGRKKYLLHYIQLQNCKPTFYFQNQWKLSSIIPEWRNQSCWINQNLLLKRAICIKLNLSPHKLVNFLYITNTFHKDILSPLLFHHAHIFEKFTFVLSGFSFRNEAFYTYAFRSETRHVLLSK